MMPNNRSQAWRKAQTLDASLKKNEVKEIHFVEFMKKVFDRGAAEIASLLDNQSNNKVWYLPIFDITTQRNQIK